jgi:hypothetical protein
MGGLYPFGAISGTRFGVGTGIHFTHPERSDCDASTQTGLAWFFPWTQVLVRNDFPLPSHLPFFVPSRTHHLVVSLSVVVVGEAALPSSSRSFISPLSDNAAPTLLCFSTAASPSLDDLPILPNHAISQKKISTTTGSLRTSRPHHLIHDAFHHCCHRRRRLERRRGRGQPSQPRSQPPTQTQTPEEGEVSTACVDLSTPPTNRS